MECPVASVSTRCVTVVMLSSLLEKLCRSLGDVTGGSPRSHHQLFSYPFLFVFLHRINSVMC